MSKSKIDLLVGTWVSIVGLHTQDVGILVRCKNGVGYRVEDIWFFESDILLILGSIVILKI